METVEIKIKIKIKKKHPSNGFAYLKDVDSLISLVSLGMKLMIAFITLLTYFI